MSNKNAGLATKEEAMKRMIDGEVFYHDDSKFYYNQPTDSGNGRARFLVDRTDSGMGKDDIMGLWSTFKRWTVKTEWTADVSKENPILCWVWDGEEDKRVAQVTKYQQGYNYPYITEDTMFEHAEPVKEGEIKLYED